MTDKEKSPMAIFREHCEKGELAYQLDPASGQAVFYPMRRDENNQLGC